MESYVLQEFPKFGNENKDATPDPVDLVISSGYLKSIAELFE